MANKTDKVIRKTRNPITGLVHVTGEHDTGKTVFALSNGAQPERIAFFDDDIKGRNTVTQLKRQGFEFGLYVDLVDVFKDKREIEINEAGQALIDAIKPGEFDCVVWDTWTRFESSFYAVVQKNPTRFKEFYAPMGKIKAGEMWQMSFAYEATIIDALLAKVPLVILTTHLKDDYLNDKKTGKQIPDAKKTLNQKSNFRVWLRHNPDSPEPIGLVLKRPVKLEATDSGIMPINILPRKMKPFTWERVIKYWNTPVGNRPLTEDEKPDEFELSILDGTLTNDQKNILRLATLEAEKEMDEARQVQALDDGLNGHVPEWVAGAKAMKAEHKSSAAIAKELNVPIAEVNRLTKE